MVTTTTTRTEPVARSSSNVTSRQVVLIAKPDGPQTGLGAYVDLLHRGLREVGVDAVRIAPTVPPLPQAGYTALRRMGFDPRTFLLNYPVWAKYPNADLYHITSQSLASLLLVRPPSGKVIVTVHDILPHMLRNDPQLSTFRTAADRLFDRMAMEGLRRADKLITISQYTKQCVVEYLGIAPGKIYVVYHGTDHERFHPQAVPTTLRERYGLPEGPRYLIYVGSEDPRKNLAVLVRSLAEVRRSLPDVELIKVGRAHFDRERQHLVELATQVGVRSAIHFLDEVPEEDLPLLYNLAQTCVMPSLYEGFGRPALEAMACGTPVICARATSLPEVVGDAGVLVDMDDDAPRKLATAIIDLLAHPDKIRALQTASLARAANFDWSKCAQQVIDIYK